MVFRRPGAMPGQMPVHVPPVPASPGPRHTPNQGHSRTGSGATGSTTTTVSGMGHITGGGGGFGGGSGHVASHREAKYAAGMGTGAGMSPALGYQSSTRRGDGTWSVETGSGNMSVNGSGTGGAGIGTGGGDPRWDNERFDNRPRSRQHLGGAGYRNDHGASSNAGGSGQNPAFHQDNHRTGRTGTSRPGSKTDGSGGGAAGVPAEQLHFSVLIRLPFSRGEFVDPPPVDWNEAMDRELWSIISGAGLERGGGIDWDQISAQFGGVPEAFLVQQAAWLYERHLAMVREQMRKVGKAPRPVSVATSTNAAAAAAASPGVVHPDRDGSVPASVRAGEVGTANPTSGAQAPRTTSAMSVRSREDMTRSIRLPHRNDSLQSRFSQAHGTSGSSNRQSNIGHGSGTGPRPNTPSGQHHPVTAGHTQTRTSVSSTTTTGTVNTSAAAAAGAFAAGANQRAPIFKSSPGSGFTFPDPSAHSDDEGRTGSAPGTSEDRDGDRGPKDKTKNKDSEDPLMRSMLFRRPPRVGSFKRDGNQNQNQNQPQSQTPQLSAGGVKGKEKEKEKVGRLKDDDQSQPPQTLQQQQARPFQRNVPSTSSTTSNRLQKPPSRQWNPTVGSESDSESDSRHSNRLPFVNRPPSVTKRTAGSGEGSAVGSNPPPSHVRRVNTSLTSHNDTSSAPPSATPATAARARAQAQDSLAHFTNLSLSHSVSQTPPRAGAGREGFAAELPPSGSPSQTRRFNFGLRSEMGGDERAEQIPVRGRDGSTSRTRASVGHERDVSNEPVLGKSRLGPKTSPPVGGASTASAQVPKGGPGRDRDRDRDRDRMPLDKAGRHHPLQRIESVESLESLGTVSGSRSRSRSTTFEPPSRSRSRSRSRPHSHSRAGKQGRAGVQQDGGDGRSGTNGGDSVEVSDAAVRDVEMDVSFSDFENTSMTSSALAEEFLQTHPNASGSSLSFLSSRFSRLTE